MKITGIETIDGIPMCKAVYETNTKDEKLLKIRIFLVSGWKNLLSGMSMTYPEKRFPKSA